MCHLDLTLTSPEELSKQGGRFLRGRLSLCLPGPSGPPGSPRHRAAVTTRTSLHPKCLPPLWLASLHPTPPLPMGARGDPQGVGQPAHTLLRRGAGRRGSKMELLQRRPRAQRGALSGDSLNETKTMTVRATLKKSQMKRAPSSSKGKCSVQRKPVSGCGPFPARGRRPPGEPPASSPFKPLKRGGVMPGTQGAQASSPPHEGTGAPGLPQGGTGEGSSPASPGHHGPPGCT